MFEDPEHCNQFKFFHENLFFFRFAEEEYKRLSEALADEGTYNAVAFRYSADYYDPSQPTEEEEANKEAGGIRTSLETTQLQKPHTYFELLLESA